MKHKFIATNATMYVTQEINKAKENLLFSDLNFISIREKIDIKDVLELIKTFPSIDEKKVLVIDVKLYSKSEIKEIISELDKNDFNECIFIYYFNNSSEKLDKSLEKLFNKKTFDVSIKNGVNLKEVQALLKENNLNISSDLFINHGSMDLVLNDIYKLKNLNERDLVNAKYYISESLESNIFELIDLILKKDIDNSIRKARLLEINESPYFINLMILKQFNLIRHIKNIGKSDNLNKEVALREKFSGGTGSPIHPYRLTLLKKSINTKINLDKAIEILIENEIHKKINIENTILKIFLA